MSVTLNSQHIAALENMAETMGNPVKTVLGANLRVKKALGMLPTGDYKYRVVMREDGRFIPFLILSQEQIDTVASHAFHVCIACRIVVTDLRTLETR